MIASPLKTFPILELSQKLFIVFSVLQKIWQLYLSYQIGLRQIRSVKRVKTSVGVQSWLKMLPRLLWWSSLPYPTSTYSCRSVEERDLIWPHCLNIPNNGEYCFKVIVDCLFFKRKERSSGSLVVDRSESFFAQHQRSVHWLYGAPSSPDPGWRDRTPTVDAVLDLCAQ